MLIYFIMHQNLSLIAIRNSCQKMIQFQILKVKINLDL